MSKSSYTHSLHKHDEYLLVQLNPSMYLSEIKEATVQNLQ